MSRSMNAEAVFADLVDVVLKAAREAPTEHVARDGYYRMVIGDVAHAVAGLVPVERVAEPVFYTPPFAKEIAEAAARGGHDGEGAVATLKYNSKLHTIKSPEVTVFQATVGVRKVTAVVQHLLDADKWAGSLHLNGETVCYFTPNGDLGRNVLEMIVRGAVRGFCSRLGKNKRMRQNKAALAAREVMA